MGLALLGIQACPVLARALQYTSRGARSRPAPPPAGLFGRHSTGTTMTTNRRSAGVMGVVLAFDQRGDFDGLRRRMLMLLGVWIAYFVIVEAFIRTLGRIIVPIVNVPLSAVLVAQGCVLLFLGALYLLARHGREV
jgi:hypothetical protein